MAEADVVLLVGTRMDSRTTMNNTVPSPESQVDSGGYRCPSEIGSNMHATVGIVADAKLALQALKNALAERTRARSRWLPKPRRHDATPR